MKHTHRAVMSYAVGLMLLLGIAAAAHAAPITLVDRQNQGTVDGTNGGASFGQSFTPTLPAIDAIEFFMAGLGQTVMVNILDGLAGADGLGGPVIATSDPVTVFTLSGPQNIHFDFPARVALTPGQLYVAQLFTPGGIEGVSWTTGDAYGGGQFLQEGLASSDFVARDLIFAEGLTYSLSLPESSWLFSLGLLGAGLATRRRQPPPNTCAAA
ncbi:hypothetical protein [Nitrococcus mobilis]|uniref:PEP-CTERM protein-sorting domain-containing protein n=1 Tax=Nitrococcus mobilis Nb-231 TaxID=314278 RepID=A4BV34_9GAMM|nr:hypothetical protein [Nitrococcus mobilis]EAR20455.1 hypothetical protein NB231_14041 [Nitrococcus mobilis Nb-231]